jgi:ABC-type transport system involved in multi-copper enzyme maturation permease subunit
MLTVIVKREILEHLISPKFLIGIAITTALMATSTVMNLANYRQRQQDYLDAQREMQGDRVTTSIFRSPQTLSVFVQGLDRKLGTQMKVDSTTIPARLSGYMGEYVSGNPRLSSGFETVDLAFVVRVVLSLMVIFLAYNAVSEEKSHGTLRLVLSNSIPRDQLLMGKFLGGLFVILGSMIVSALLSILLVVMSRSMPLGRADWARIAGMLGISALYLICFYTCGLFVSVLVNRPAIALMVLLQVWIFFVVIYPNLSIVIAENFRRLPTQEEVSRMKQAAFQPYDAEYRKVLQEIRQGYSSPKGPDKDVSSHLMELFSLRAESDYKVDQDFSRRLGEQVRLAHGIAIMSPAALYDIAMTRLARTDLTDYERFMTGVLPLWRADVERTKLLYKDVRAYRKATVPPFSYVPETLAESFGAAALQGSILLFLGIVFFVLAYTIFLRKDVR